MSRLSFAGLALGPALLIAAAAVAPASQAAGRPGGSGHDARIAGSWHVAFTVKGPNQPSFTAVTASGAQHAWAFEESGGKAPAAYQLSGTTWKLRSFPARRGDTVVAASSSSASNVWAFTFGGKALRFNGSSWAKVRTFAAVISSGLAISKTDVWVFTGPATWHFNGVRWAKSASGRGLSGASALAAKSIWAFGGTNVAHWNGTRWKKTSVASLLPKNTALSHSFLAGIDALSARNVYAVGSGGRQDEGGPLVLLHFNGARWKRIALASKLGGPVTVIGDGAGGLWIPVLTGFPGSASMEHFAHGALSNTPLPITPPHLALFAAAIGPRSTAALAVGYRRTSFSATTTTAVILRFGR